MLAIVKQLTPTGLRFPLPITGDNRHADFAPAAAGAVAKVGDSSGSWMVAMKRRMRNENENPATGYDLRTARELAGLTVFQLAEKSGRDSLLVQLTEQGRDKPSEFFVADIMKACGLPAFWRAPRKT